MVNFIGVGHFIAGHGQDRTVDCAAAPVTCQRNIKIARKIVQIELIVYNINGIDIAGTAGRPILVLVTEAETCQAVIRAVQHFQLCITGSVEHLEQIVLTV